MVACHWPRRPRLAHLVKFGHRSQSLDRDPIGSFNAPVSVAFAVALSEGLSLASDLVFLASLAAEIVLRLACWLTIVDKISRASFSSKTPGSSCANLVRLRSSRFCVALRRTTSGLPSVSFSSSATSLSRCRRRRQCGRPPCHSFS